MDGNKIYVQQPQRGAVRAWTPRHVVTSSTNEIGRTAIARISVWGNYDDSNDTHYTYEFSNDLCLNGVAHIIEKLFNLRTELDMQSTEHTLIKTIV